MNPNNARSRTVAAVAAAGLATLGGCAAYRAENKPLSEFPGIQQQIENYYDANATEDDWECPEVQMNGIDKTKVVKQTAAQTTMAVTYYFQSFDVSAGQGGDECQGFNTRFFTFDKGPGGGQLTLVSMTGPQRGGGA
jgi:hypothetical protein